MISREASKLKLEIFKVIEFLQGLKSSRFEACNREVEGLLSVGRAPELHFYPPPPLALPVWEPPGRPCWLHLALLVAILVILVAILVHLAPTCPNILPRQPEMAPRWLNIAQHSAKLLQTWSPGPPKSSKNLQKPTVFQCFSIFSLFAQMAPQIDPEAAKLNPKWPSWQSCWPILALLTAILAPSSSNLGSNRLQDVAWKVFFLNEPIFKGFPASQ